MKKESLLTSGRGQDRRYSSPRLLGSIISEMLHSDSPLAKGYRKYLASKGNSAEKGGEL